MVHHQRSHHHHQVKKGVQAVVDSEYQTQTMVLEFENRCDYCTNNYYKKVFVKPRLVLLLFLFTFVSASLFFAPHFFNLYSYGLENVGSILVGAEADSSICSSMPQGSICCDRSNFRSDICFMKGDIRTHSASSSVILYASDNDDNNNGVFRYSSASLEEEELQHEKIKPYTRKWETSVMDTIDELNLVAKKVLNVEDSHSCDVQHSVPAIIFSNGGYTGNVYHEFNDGILPLYITSQHLKKEVVFVVLEFHEWWMTKYGDIISRLSNYAPIDFSRDNKTHCFPKAIVGLKIHDELTVDSSLMQGNKSIRHFHMLLDKAYWPRIEGLIQDEERVSKLFSPPSPSPLVEEKKEGEVDSKETLGRPKLVIVSRNGSRAINNEEALVDLAEEIGFQVEVLKPDRTSEMAKIYRSLNSSDIMIGVHGAAMTHFLFMRPGTVFIQVVPLGTDWAAQTYYGEPSVKLGLKYIGYKILPKESSLFGKYGKDDLVLRDPESVNARGWEYTKKYYLDGQNVNLNLGRFRKRLVRAFGYTISKRNRVSR
ncbi:hypothetical protein GIB67_040041 [Kingdonia uniflora]|uniref:Glycosyltransferase 61 catalytic domain-containing protein n=1 Tax=Kingdonia uniflora TaxID=39325 RepID=A0A7J7MUN1_9MAGN|nr:hypothetical protein GIB67_040041 [Kingdonia uniflora]